MKWLATSMQKKAKKVVPPSMSEEHDTQDRRADERRRHTQARARRVHLAGARIDRRGMAPVEAFSATTHLRPVFLLTPG